MVFLRWSCPGTWQLFGSRSWRPSPIFAPWVGQHLSRCQEKKPGTSGSAAKSGHHEPAGCTTATQLDHQKAVPCSLPAICTLAKGKGTPGRESGGRTRNKMLGEMCRKTCQAFCIRYLSAEHQLKPQKKPQNVKWKLSHVILSRHPRHLEVTGEVSCKSAIITKLSA